MSEMSLPDEWMIVEIENVLAVQSDGKLVHQGWSPQCDREAAADNEWGVLKTTAIQDGYFLDNENKRLPKDKEPKDRIEVRKGDLLVTNAGPRNRCGIICYVKNTRGKLMLSGKMYRLRFPEEAICPEYIESWLRTSQIQKELNDRKTGISESGLNMTQARFLTLPIMLAPLAEQKVIAEKLNVLLAKVKATQAQFEQIPNILKTFRQSVLASAVNGKLTEEWVSNGTAYYDQIDADISQDSKLKKLSPLAEEDIGQAKSFFNGADWHKWRLYPLELLVDPNRGIPYGIVQTGEPDLNGIPTIRCGDVKPLAVDMRELKLVSREIEAQYSRTRLTGSEVILAIRGTVGNAAVITEEMAKPPLNISREVAMIPVRSNINPYFVSILLQSPGGYRCLAEKTKGVAQRGINLADVKRLVTPLPTYDEQTEIVRRVEELFAFADNIEEKANSALNRINNLTQSILNKAFRGELTADWRAANPELISGKNSAEALLERIKAEREAMKPIKKTRTRKKA